MATSFEELVPPKGRGVPENPPNRFERLHVEVEEETLQELLDADPEFKVARPQTLYFRDDSQSLLSRNDSPDLSFNFSINPYRGCEHGCAYCYARTYHEYLGFSAGLDFETRIMVKPNAPELLRKELTAPKWEPQPLAMSGATDCYQPVEKQLQITRGCLEVLAAVLNPVTVVTKNHLVTRDLDHLQRLAHYRASAVMLSITTLDSKLAARLEPRASSPSFRLQAIRELNEAGVPAGVSVAPVIPGLNEHEIPAILEAAADHGAAFAVYSIVRLPRQMPELFAAWLHRHFPDRADRVLGRIRQIRGGELDDSRFRSRMTGEGKLAEEIGTLFRVSARRMGLSDRRLTLSTDFFCHGGPTQLQLF